MDGDDVFLLADKNLDCKPYNETNANISWEDCSLQKWVNTDFLNGAFSGLQQLAVKQTRRAVEDNSGTGASGISYSTEKIYLLSNIEATNPAYGFCAGSQKESETKEVKNTDYASECGAATCTEEDYNGNGYSWLRSAAGNMSIVHYDGNSFGGLNVTSKFCGVRPALHLDIDYSELWSYAGQVTANGGKIVSTPTPLPTTNPATTEENKYGISNPSTDGDDSVSWDCIYFGNYPQNEYFPKQQPENPISGTVYEDSDGTKMLYKKGIVEEYDTQKDCCVEVVCSKYFKIEPIKWRVLSIDGDDAFLLSDRNLDCQAYYSPYYNVTWGDSELCKWLNKTFYNTAFTDLEQNAITETKVITTIHEGTDGSPNSRNKVYLLSIEDIINSQYGFISDVDKKSKTRESKNTSYAQFCGAWTCTDEEYEGNGWWWLRSLGDSSRKALEVNNYGYVVNQGVYACYGNYAVRPVLHLNLSSSDLWEKAGKINSEGEVVLPSNTSSPSPTVSPTMPPLTPTASPSVTPTGNPTMKPTSKPNKQPEDDSNKNNVVIRTTLKDSSGATYKVLTENTVAYIKPHSKTVTKAVIPLTVTINGTTFVVSSVAKNAFVGCTKLKSVIIGKNVTSIGDKAFYNCKSLQKITIPAKVTKIGKQAFANCKKMKLLTIKSSKLTAKSVGSKAFKGIYKKPTVKVPKKKKKVYKKMLIAKGMPKKVKIK